jgi:adenylosuccinate synthase
MNKDITNVDICCGLAWGDEGKGKIVSYLSKTKNYDFVCRWSGGNNAGHTIYVNHIKYKTHLIPSGIFYGIKSIIGPDCVINIKSFFEEIKYLEENGFDTNLIKVSRNAHIIEDTHIEEDKTKLKNKLGTTARGIAPCYRDKYARIGKRVVDYKDIFSNYIWDDNLYGNILCEGAQGFWLDINYGNYPYITSSITLPYNACSLGFAPQLINKIYGAVKIYDTRVGKDPEFPESLFDNDDFKIIGELGSEFGVSTGRKRKVNWLNMDKLILAINISGTTDLIVSKVDIIEKAKKFKVIYKEEVIEYQNINEMLSSIKKILISKCKLLKNINFSNNVDNISMD